MREGREERWLCEGGEGKGRRGGCVREGRGEERWLCEGREGGGEVVV